MTKTRTAIAALLAALLAAVALTVGIAAPAAADVNVAATGNAVKVGLNGHSLSIANGNVYGWYIVRNATPKAKRITVTLTVGDGIVLTRTHKVGAFDDIMVTLDGEPVTATAAGTVSITATR